VAVVGAGIAGIAAAVTLAKRGLKVAVVESRSILGMKIYKKIVLDSKNKILEEKYFYYTGPIAMAGIHYDFKSTKGNKLMEKQAKREKKLAERKAKREAKEGPKKTRRT
jgi:cation diffusion facilitator CzcD-associated flavoprotein CzcO